MTDRTILNGDPKAEFLAHEPEIRAAIDRVLRSGHYILGPEVAAFEEEFSVYQGGGCTIGVANGTEALELALRAVGVEHGDAVATVANTVSATAAAIQQIGARLVFVEIDPVTMLMSAEALADELRRHGGAIKAVVPVHLYGHLADMGAIMRVARDHGAKVVEDCAQAHGAEREGRRAGTWGDAAAFSFYPTKNLGALGDGGAVFTRDREIAERVRESRQYGWRRRYVSEIPGRNSRLDEMQAAILRVKLRHLDDANALRAALAGRYRHGLSGAPLVLPRNAPGEKPAWHQFVVRTTDREALRRHLESRRIFAGVLYPVPLHRQPAYANGQWHLPETERACAEVLSLPIHSGISTRDVDRVCAEILGWVRP